MGHGPADPPEPGAGREHLTPADRSGKRGERRRLPLGDERDQQHVVNDEHQSRKGSAQVQVRVVSHSLFEGPTKLARRQVLDQRPANVIRQHRRKGAHARRGELASMSGGDP